jgi:hypothetical protein
MTRSLQGELGRNDHSRRERRIASNSAERLESTGLERPHARRATGSVGRCDIWRGPFDLRGNTQVVARSRFGSGWCGSPGMQRAGFLQRAVVQRDRRRWRASITARGHPQSRLLIVARNNRLALDCSCREGSSRRLAGALVRSGARRFRNTCTSCGASLPQACGAGHSIQARPVRSHH